tara:strand:+ start:45 stop:860 length:816 start_codon:yes stop_codon:yes gene_type:complete
MNVFLANNSGLGDYILMNGATRYVAAQPEVNRVHLLCVGTHNKFTQVEWMYRDNPNIIVYGEPAANSFSQARKKIRTRYKRMKKEFSDLHKRAFFWGSQDWYGMMPRFGLDREKNCWPELFYAAHQAPYSARHEYFHVERDLDKEDKLFNSLNLPSEYAFCVDVASSGHSPFNLSNIKLPIFKPHSRPDLIESCHIFDWMTVIENATELHTVDTGWFHLIKQMKLDKKKYFYHVRQMNELKNVLTSCYINDEHDNGWKILGKNGNVIENLF